MNPLTKKQYKQYDRVSRYSPFPYYYNNVDKKYVYGVTANLYIGDTPFVAHTVKETDTWDSLALYYYNNPTYYWIICDFNRVTDPFVEPKCGTVIKIPTFSAITYNL